MMGEEVISAFDAFRPDARAQLLRMRDLIFETAHTMPEVGPIEEALRWGQPAYLTSESKSGTTIRLGTAGGDGLHVAMFFNCRTTLVGSFRGLFDDVFQFEGDRAILVPVAQPVPKEELAECIAMALAYHRRTVSRATNASTKK